MKLSNILKCLGCVIAFGWAAMLYWSSVLQEQDLKLLRREIQDLHAETASLQHKISRDMQAIQRPLSEKTSQIPDHSDYPNLLEEDTYQTTQLPRLLGESFRPQGILKKAIVGTPDNLHPFNNFKDVHDMYNLCLPAVSNFKTGCFETLSPSLAVKIEARPCSDLPHAHEYWVFLRDDIFWTPLQRSHFPSTFELAQQFLTKQPVTAHDFKFYYDAVMNPYLHEPKAVSLRNYLGDIESFTVINDTTFVVRWKTHQVPSEKGSDQKVKYTALGITAGLQPLPRFVYQYFADGQKIIDDDADPDIYRKNSVWAQNFSLHWAKNVIVGCGPYLFEGMTDEGVSFKRNPHYFDPNSALVEGVKISFKESLDAIWQDFKAGKVDLCILSPNQLGELETFLKSAEYRSQKEIKSLDYVDLSFFYIGWNQAKPFFKDERVRKAMTLAIDRNRIIEQNLNRMGVATTGPCFVSSPSYDQTISPYPYRPEEARQLLEEAGWVDLDGDGIRDKIVNGQKVAFRFKMYYFVKNLTSKVIAEYITTSLRTIGIHCELVGLDIADLSRQFNDKNFDAIFMGWKLGSPPEDFRQIWHSSGALEKGSSNAIGFENVQVDSIIDELDYEYHKPNRIALYHQFHHIIHEESPYTFLYTPKVRLLYREYVHNLFVPKEHQEIIPGADMTEPHLHSIWLSK